MTQLIDSDLTGEIRERMPFAAELGIEVLEASPERVRVQTHWAPERCTSFGIIHGGFLMAVADSVGGAVTVRNLPPGAGTTTIESKTNLFRAVREGTMVATGEPVHVGRSTIVVTTTIRDANGKLVAQTTQTQLVLYPDATPESNNRK